MSSPYRAWTSQTNTPLDSSKYSFICDQNLKYSSAIASEYLRFWSQMKEYLEESSGYLSWILLFLFDLQEVLHYYTTPMLKYL